MCGFIYLLLCVAPQASEDSKVDGLLKEIEAQKKLVRLFLGNEKMWDDPSKKSDLLKNLELAGILKVDDLAPVLVKHILFSPNGMDNFSPGGVKPIYVKFPVLVVLTRIGLPVVPELVELLKKTDPEDNKKGGSRKRALAIYCLVKIYDRESSIYEKKELFGSDLARLRIELEMKKTTDKENEYLSKALNTLLKK